MTSVSRHLEFRETIRAVCPDGNEYKLNIYHVFVASRSGHRFRTETLARTLGGEAARTLNQELTDFELINTGLRLRRKDL
jgi:hypothetical protein